MRAAFNTTMNVYLGDFAQATPPPIILAAGVPCRVVPQNEITYAGSPFSAIGHWVTFEGSDVTKPFYSTDLAARTMTIAYWTGSVLEILDGSGLYFQVVFVQDVTTDSDSYHRALVIPYPVFV